MRFLFALQLPTCLLGLVAAARFLTVEGLDPASGLAVAPPFHPRDRLRSVVDEHLQPSNA
ncbi:MAG: hypothetical protein RIR77_1473 [Planctomycetota bacterium]|jgi:hypothetical protein